MNISHLVTLSLKEIPKGTLVIDEQVRTWCKLPYGKLPNGKWSHPHGCPNYNNRENCPPKSPFRQDILEKYDHFYLLWAKFNFEQYKIEFAREWKEKNGTTPTEGQVGCNLYWQSAVKKMHKEFIESVYKMNKDKIKSIEMFANGTGFKSKFVKQDTICSMESVGLFAYSIAQRNGIKMEKIRNAKNFHILALICSSQPLITHDKKKSSQKQQTLF